MGIISSEKIFIDPREEINFVIDRMINSERDQLIFVIPQGAILLSSPLSIAILFKEMSKTNKVGIIVTEDDYGLRIARKANFIAVAKVSQITAADWDNALTKKLKYIDQQETRKNELLSNIGLVDKLNQSDFSGNADDAIQLEESAEDDIAEELPIDKDKKAEEDALKMYHKPRKESKVIEVGGIRLATAGDIRSFGNSTQSLENTKDKDDIVKPQPVKDRNFTPVVGSTSFAGKDFTKVVKKKPNTGIVSKLFGSRREPVLDSPSERELFERNRRKKIFTVLGVIGLIATLGTGYLMAFQLSSVDIVITFKKEDVSASTEVLLNPDITEISYAPATIPTRIISEENISVSRTGEASGKGRGGIKAKGFITIYNITDAQVSLPAGTKVSNLTGEAYIITKSVTLDPAEESLTNEVTASTADNVPIEAADFGPDFNIPLSAETVNLQISGYEDEFASKKVYARVVGEVAGGKLEEFTSVSEENIDKLKGVVEKELVQQGENKIRSLIPTGYTLLSDTIEFKEESMSSIPKLGEKTSDGKFTLSLQGSVSAFIVSNDDLKSLAERFLTSDNNNDLGDDDSFILDDIDLPQIVGVSKNESGLIKITITSQASIGIRPSDDSIKSAIIGKSIEDAQIYLSSIESVDNARVSYAPSFIPNFLRRVPSDTDRISIRTH